MVCLVWGFVFVWFLIFFNIIIMEKAKLLTLLNAVFGFDLAF